MNSALARGSRTVCIEDAHQVVDAAFERVGEPQDHGQARNLDASLQIADEWVIRSAPRGELGLCEAAREPQFAQSLPENHAFIRDHRAAIHLTDSRSDCILSDT